MFGVEKKLPIPFPHYAKKLPKFYLLKILRSKESRAKRKKNLYLYLYLKYRQKRICMSRSKYTTHDFTWGCSKVREVINTEKYQYYQKDNST